MPCLFRHQTHIIAIMAIRDVSREWAAVLHSYSIQYFLEKLLFSRCIILRTQVLIRVAVTKASVSAPFEGVAVAVAVAVVVGTGRGSRGRGSGSRGTIAFIALPSVLARPSPALLRCNSASHTHNIMSLVYRQIACPNCNCPVRWCLSFNFWHFNAAVT